MRRDCKNFESRTYANGETVRKCNIDLAPDAPWRCPENCPQFARRTMDIGWQYGSLTSAVAPPEPEPATPDDANVAALLDEAEDIINSAAPSVLADFAPKKKRFKRKKKK